MAQETPPSLGPVLTGSCRLKEKMEKRTCALCPEGHEWSQIYFVPSANIAAHENCLLYSSGLVECEAHEPCNVARHFDVRSILEKIWRGSMLICSFCKNKGAVVECGETSCAKNYHLLCAKEDHAVLQAGVTRTYKVFCSEHCSKQEETTESADSPSMKKRRGRKKRLSPGPPTEPKMVKFMRSKRRMTGEPLSHRDAAAKAPFLKKCKEAGLLTELFEQILDKMHSIHGRFMDETASESDYEGIETLLFGCGLFKDILRKFQEGDCPVIEKMEKRTCALCPEGHEWSQIYFAPSANIAAHENCLLYSSGLVECEVHDAPNTTRNFDVKSVKKEIWRGRRLKCSLCNEGGATVGCDLSHCKKSYHYVCAQKDQAIPQVDGDHGIYKVFCPEHPPQQEETTESADSPSMKKKKGRKKRLSPGPPTEPKKMKFSSSKRHMMEEPDDRTAAKASFLKKCQEAGLLTELFEQILEKVDSIHGRFMDETASESDYEGIETLLFDCGLFGDTLRKFQEVIKSKVCESEERQRQMKQQLEALADLQQNLSSFQDNGDLDHSSSASGSSLPPEDHQVRCQGSPEVQAGSGDSL